MQDGGMTWRERQALEEISEDLRREAPDLARRLSQGEHAPDDREPCALRVVLAVPFCALCCALLLVLGLALS